jgi:N-dimethylarginine dimethylaminohydrolase
VAVINYGVFSEYGRLASVLLYKPGPETGNLPDPAAIQQLRPIDPEAISHEFDSIIKTFEELGVEVIRIDPSPLSQNRSYLYNMMYCRDLLFMTPCGAIIGKMANATRQEEVLYARRTLETHDIPVLHQVSGEGRFEGADALWINERLVAVGIGNRTNMEAFTQLEAVLARQGVKAVPLASHQTKTQHLLGSLQLVDREMALVRHEIVDPEMIRFLKAHQFKVISVSENSDVTDRQAMNIVTVAPRTILMTAGCPETKKLYLEAGLKVAAELELSQLINGAGGLACATGILARV